VRTQGKGEPPPEAAAGQWGKLPKIVECSIAKMGFFLFYNRFS
jgi:hypothetical protein